MCQLDRLGIKTRIGAVDPVDAGVRALEDGGGADLGGPQRGGGVGREVGVARTGGEHDHPPLFEVADGAPRDVGLGDLGHRDRGLDARRLPHAFERVLQRERVDDGRQHPHVVGSRPVHAALGAGHAAEDVPAADHYRDLHAQLGVRGGDLFGDALDHGGVDPRARGRVGEHLTGELQHHPVVPGRLPQRVSLRFLSAAGPVAYSAPTWIRTNRRMVASLPSSPTS